MPSELFTKIRAHLVICILVVMFPIVVTFAFIHKALEFVFKYQTFKNIAGEIAVVTGSGHGLGRCIALELAKRGAHIAVVDINLDGAEETVEQIKDKYNVKCKAYKIDVTDYKQVENLNNDIKKDLGVATILVNNAGIVTMSSFAKPHYEEIQRMINVNLTAHFWTNRVFLENMKECRKGHIVAIGSIAGYFPLVYNTVYCGTKFGVRGMMRAMRLDLEALDLNFIKTTLVCPSFLRTNDHVVELSKVINFGDYYPLIRGEDAARTIVHAVLRNEIEVTLPRFVAILIRLLDFFPAGYHNTLINIAIQNFADSFNQIYHEQEQIALKSK